jgi:hypothetical protein
MKVKLFALLAVGALLIGGLPYMLSAEEVNRAQSSIVAGTVGTIAAHLAKHPQAALDLTEVSGEYCFNAKLGKGGMMLHFSVNPEETTEDVVSFYNATPMIEAGLKEDRLAPFCGKLGCMENNTWYFLPAGTYEPHHGVKFPFPLIIKAMDIV